MYQKITLVGNLGNDPEMRYLPSGSPVTNFSMATNRRWTNQQTGEPGEETVWWRVAVFGPQAEACNQYLTKGRQVLVEGRMRPDPGTGKPRVYQRQDGSMGASYELTANTVQFLGSKSDGNADAAPAPDGPAEQGAADGIPF